MSTITIRSSDLQAFVDAAHVAFGTFAHDPRATRSLARIFQALERPAAAERTTGERLPVCSYLAAAAAPESFGHDALRRLAEAFLRLEPALIWRRRGGKLPLASASFAEGHANAMIAGPSGLEPRDDVWLGVILLAPHVRYPDHTHPPEETYLVMSDGEFSQGRGPWFRPGLGGSLYNPPGIVHAMRSLDAPLFTFWTLRVELAISSA